MTHRDFEKAYCPWCGHELDADMICTQEHCGEASLEESFREEHTEYGCGDEHPHQSLSCFV
jgi:hypothetical protein